MFRRYNKETVRLIALVPNIRAWWIESVQGLGRIDQVLMFIGLRAHALSDTLTACQLSTQYVTMMYLRTPVARHPMRR